MLLRAAAQALLTAPPERMTFWSGAGISGDPPTQAPLGYKLTDRALVQAFDSEALLDALRSAYAALCLPRDRPRLESALDVAAAEHGTDVLGGLLVDLRDPSPNGSHEFFAEHTRRGGRHVTANFDTCIERAGGDPARIMHVHGSFTTTGGVETLGARLSRIERGFNVDQKNELDALLTDMDLLVVVGYSGLDYFDVDPYWRDAAARGLFRGRRVVWVNHASDWGLVSGRACQRKQLRIFADIGEAEVHQVDAPTRQVLNLLAAAWGLPPLPDPPAWQARSEPQVILAPPAQERATTRFLATAGLRGAVRQRLAAHSLDQEERLWAADAAWAAGRYREAARHWALAYPGDDPVAVAASQERQAACLWLRGRLRAARQLLRHTLADAGPEVDPEQRLVIAETLGRVLVHMRRLPDTRPLVSRAWVSTALVALDDVENALRENAQGRSLPVHLRARAESVRADLTGSPRPTRSDDGGPVRDFDESEALLPMLNYEHAQLRARAEAARRGDGDPPARWEYVRLRDRFRALGDTADAARVPLLPGAGRAFGVPEVIRGLAACDFTPYHLARLVVLHLLQRLLDR